MRWNGRHGSDGPRDSVDSPWLVRSHAASSHQLYPHCLYRSHQKTNFNLLVYKSSQIYLIWPLMDHWALDKLDHKTLATMLIRFCFSGDNSNNNNNNNDDTTTTNNNEVEVLSKGTSSAPLVWPRCSVVDTHLQFAVQCVFVCIIYVMCVQRKDGALESNYFFGFQILQVKKMSSVFRLWEEKQLTLKF